MDSKSLVHLIHYLCLKLELTVIMAAQQILEGDQGWFNFPLLMPLVTTTICLIVFHYWQQNQRIAKLGNLIPGPPTLPFLGNAHYFIGKNHNEILEMILRLGEIYTNVVKLWLGPKLVVILTNPVDIEIILSSNVHLSKSDEYRFLKPLLGNGLLNSEGDHWRSHRKLIAPAFHQNVLKSFLGIFYSNSVNVVKRMEKEIGKVFDVHDYMSETTVDIMMETAMGHKRIRDNEDDGFKYAMAVMKLCDILYARQLKMYLRFDSIFNLTNMKKQQEKLLAITQGFTKREKTALFATSEMIAKVEKSPTKKVEGLRDDLDENDENDVARNGANLNDDEIKEEVDTIMFGGHETIAAGSSFVFCLLGIHQDIQARVYEEMKTIFGDSKRECSFTDTTQIKYLERVILEMMRIYPPIAHIGRQINEDVQLKSQNYIFPAGCTVVIATLKVHRRRDIYPNPEQFNPDNFLPERMQDRHYYSFIPFSAGPRSCIGRKYAMIKLKVLISTILRNYKINSSLTEKDFKLQADLVLKRSDGFRIEIEKRQTKI